MLTGRCEKMLNKSFDETPLTKTLGEVESTEDAHTAAVVTREVVVMEGADEADFGRDGGDVESGDVDISVIDPGGDAMIQAVDGVAEDAEPEYEEREGGHDEGGTIVDANSRYISLRRRHMLG